MSRWTRTTPITEAEANAEPLEQQLFGPDFNRRQRQIRARSQREVTIARDPWRKPRIDRRATQQRGNR